jgi:hypothetical protein
MKLWSSSRMRLGKREVPVGDRDLAVFQLAAVGVHAQRQLDVLPRFYVLAVQNPLLLDVALDRVVRAALLHQPFDHVA